MEERGDVGWLWVIRCDGRVTSCVLEECTSIV
jgi:hypothetical protein